MPQIIALVEKGIPVAQICRMKGFPDRAATIREWLEAAGIPPCPDKATGEQAILIRQLVEEGKSFVEIKDALGVQPSVASRWLRNLDISIEARTIALHVPGGAAGLIEMHRAGLNQEQIAAECAVHPSTVARWLASLALPPSSVPEPTPEQLAAVIELADRGVPIYQIMRNPAIKRGHKTVKAWLILANRRPTYKGNGLASGKSRAELLPEIIRLHEEGLSASAIARVSPDYPHKNTIRRWLRAEGFDLGYVPPPSQIVRPPKQPKTPRENVPRRTSPPRKTPPPPIERVARPVGHTSIAERFQTQVSANQDNSIGSFKVIHLEARPPERRLAFEEIMQLELS
jgi:transcriptional regulator with XRE-family HTH domain